MSQGARRMARSEDRKRGRRPAGRSGKAASEPRGSGRDAPADESASVEELQAALERAERDEISNEELEAIIARSGAQGPGAAEEDPDGDGDGDEEAETDAGEITGPDPHGTDEGTASEAPDPDQGSPHLEEALIAAGMGMAAPPPAAVVVARSEAGSEDGEILQMLQRASAGEEIPEDQLARLMDAPAGGDTDSPPPEMASVLDATLLEDAYAPGRRSSRDEEVSDEPPAFATPGPPPPAPPPSVEELFARAERGEDLDQDQLAAALAAAGYRDDGSDLNTSISTLGGGGGDSSDGLDDFVDDALDAPSGFVYESKPLPPAHPIIIPAPAFNPKAKKKRSEFDAIESIATTFACHLCGTKVPEGWTTCPRCNTKLFG